MTEIEALRRVDEVFREYIVQHGIDHDDPDCPEDDTCECENAAAINAALAATEKTR